MTEGMRVQLDKCRFDEQVCVGAQAYLMDQRGLHLSAIVCRVILKCSCFSFFISIKFWKILHPAQNTYFSKFVFLIMYAADSVPDYSLAWLTAMSPREAGGGVKGGNISS